MLSDFGTSQDMLNARTRSGNTGTCVTYSVTLAAAHHFCVHSLEYSAPESLPEPSTGQLRQVDSKADMWSLGMILHKMLFFRLPYRYTVDNDEASRPKDGRDYMDRLEAEILEYTGFKSSSILASGFESRRLPKVYLLLLETLLNVKPSGRPSSERVLGVIKDGGVRCHSCQYSIFRLKSNEESSSTQCKEVARCHPRSPLRARPMGGQAPKGLVLPFSRSRPMRVSRRSRMRTTS